jgi:hypothetical protein
MPAVKRTAQAKEEITRQYLAMYRADEELSAAIRIKKRVEKAIKKNG